MKNITFDNIRAEGIIKGNVFDLRIFMSEKYNRAPGCCISNIQFKNIFVDEESAQKMTKSRIEHYDKNRKVENITFENEWVGKRNFSETTDINSNECKL